MRPPVYLPPCLVLFLAGPIIVRLELVFSHFASTRQGHRSTMATKYKPSTVSQAFFGHWYPVPLKYFNIPSLDVSGQRP